MKGLSCFLEPFVEVRLLVILAFELHFVAVFRVDKGQAFLGYLDFLLIARFD